MTVSKSYCSRGQGQGLSNEPHDRKGCPWRGRQATRLRVLLGELRLEALDGVLTVRQELARLRQLGLVLRKQDPCALVRLLVPCQLAHTPARGREAPSSSLLSIEELKCSTASLCQSDSQTQRTSWRRQG